MKTYIQLLSVIAVILTSISVNAEVYKVSKVTHIEDFNKFDDIDITITELTYDDDGRLIHFLEYYDGRADDPRFDLTLDWGINKAWFSGLIDWDFEHGEIDLGENSLANRFFSFEGGSSSYKYSDDFLIQINSSVYDNPIVLSYQNDKLVKLDVEDRSILLNYNNTPLLCNIPHPALVHNVMFYYRFIPYAGLLGQPIKYCPTSFNRFNNGWNSLEYTFDENGNITKIYSPDGGLTHGSIKRETFIYEYVKTNSIEEVLDDKIQMHRDDNTLTFTGKASNDTIQVYDVYGRLVKVSDGNAITIETSGMYIIKVGTQTFKIIM